MIWRILNALILELVLCIVLVFYEIEAYNLIQSFLLIPERYTWPLYSKGLTKKKKKCNAILHKMLILVFQNFRPYFLRMYFFKFTTIFGAVQDGGVGKKSPFLKSVTHILQWWKMAVIISERRSKKYVNHMTHFFEFFFHRKSANFAMPKNTDIDCILIHNFWSF